MVAPLKKYPLDMRVQTTMGVKKAGKVIPPFYWKDSTDGTYRAPQSNETLIAWVLWDDGTKGWTHNMFLSPILEVVV